MKTTGKSTQVPFWRKLVIGSFKVTTLQKIVWQIFEWINPFSAGVTRGSNRRQIFNDSKVKWSQNFNNIRFYERVVDLFLLTCTLQKTYILNNLHDLENWRIWHSSQYNQLCRVRFQHYFVYASYKYSETLNAHISKLVLWHMSTFFHNSLQLYFSNLFR